MARNARQTFLRGLVAAFCFTVFTGCAARATLSDGTQLEVDTRGNGQPTVGTDGGNSTMLNDGWPNIWPWTELRAIGDQYDTDPKGATDRTLDLGREMNAKQGTGRQSAAPAGYRQRTDLYDPDQGDGYAEKNLADTHRRQRAAFKEAFGQ